MVGHRCNIEEKDTEALKTFFTNKDFDDMSSNFLKLKNRWISTNEVNTELREPYSRTKNRLLRLKQFGFIHHHICKKGTLEYSYWYITHQGLFYILSTLNEKIEITKFVMCNRDSVHDFDYIFDLIKDQEMASITNLRKQISKLVSTYQYYSIYDVIKGWYRVNFYPHYKMFSFEVPFKKLVPKAVS